jgi:hypothetical protein
MRQFVAVAFLGAALAFSASAALAYGDNADYVPSYQRTQSASVVSGTVIRSEPNESAVAGGGATASSVYRRLREENGPGDGDRRR